jgi:hypothetical protein
MLIPAPEADMNRTALALAALAALSVLFAAALRTLRRRRSSGLRLDPAPAGVKSLAWNVGSLSTFGVGLPVVPKHAWRRLGTLLGLR